MLRRFLIGLLVAAIAGFCVLYLVRHGFLSSGKKTEEAAPRTMTQVISADLVRKNAADDSWDRDLCQGQPARQTPVLTVELEKAWLTDKPILFVGKIADVRSEGSDDRLIVDRDMFWAAMLSRPLLTTGLRISVACPKAVLDAFIAANPDYLDAGNGIAVVAKIESVESGPTTGAADGVPASAKTGRGKALDLVCLRRR
ncbi:MAG TPA: hypothetical protein VMS75_04960 [Terriglobales bacterium]|nr:hypothetical protein [Terriglobales bacterium]